MTIFWALLSTVAAALPVMLIMRYLRRTPETPQASQARLKRYHSGLDVLVPGRLTVTSEGQRRLLPRDAKVEFLVRSTGKKGIWAPSWSDWEVGTPSRFLETAERIPDSAGNVTFLCGSGSSFEVKLRMLVDDASILIDSIGDGVGE